MTEIKFNFSPIKDFYSNKSILITGVTGLVGKVLLYKILKSIDTIDKVYVIIRAKRDKDVSDRIRDLFERSKGLYDDIDANTLQKVIPINGSLTDIGMKLSDNDKKAIIDNVSVVFHSAADVTFQANLKSQVLINVGGTKEVIDLCRQLNHLDALVYVSTAYSSPLEMVVNETVYTSDRNPLTVLENARNRIEMKNSEYLGEYPNTYSYTKNLAENLIKENYEKNNLPVTIVRPGIVLSSIREPKCGWFETITNIMGISMLLGTGLTNIIYVKRNITMDFIPVDIVANTCIASAHLLCTGQKRKLRVYNCNSSCFGAISYGKWLDMWAKLNVEYPLSHALRPPNVITLDDFQCNRFTKFFTETCFAHGIDLLLLLLGRKRNAVKSVRLYHSMMIACYPYVSRQWYFTNGNMIRLSKQLSNDDRITFNCDIPAIDWLKYYRNAFFGLRTIVLKEKDGDIDRTKRNMKYIKILNTTMNHLVLYLIWYLMVKFTPISGLLSKTIEAYTPFDSINFGGYLLMISAAVKSITNFIPDF